MISAVKTGTADGNPPHLYAGALAVLPGLVNFESLESIAADELSVKQFRSQIAALIQRHEFLFQRLNVHRAAVNNPVVAEISEYNGHLTVSR